MKTTIRKLLHTCLLMSVLLSFGYVKAQSLDSDGDGVLDNVDADVDNDGILNSIECAERNIIVRGNFTSIPPPASRTSDGMYNPAQFANANPGWTLVSTGTGANAKIVWRNNITLPPPLNTPFGNGIRFQNDGQTQSLSTNIEDFYHYGTPKILISKIAANNSNPTGNSSTFTVSYAGVEYARIETDDGRVTGASISYLNDASGNIAAFSVGTIYTNWEIYLPDNIPANGVLEIKFVGGSLDSDDFSMGDVIINACADTDGDGTPDYLDLNSDNDGCPDALEGDEGLNPSQLNPDGSINTDANGGVDPDGVPNLVNADGAADTGDDQGQGVGDSTDADVNNCIEDNSCYQDIIGNDFTWYSGEGNHNEWEYFNHHGWEGTPNNWDSGSEDDPEPGSPLDIYRSTIIQPGTTGGFVFDIYGMDNSFNMEINGTKLATQELQFQYNTGDQIPGNVQFADGSYTGDDDVPEIWNLYGDKASNKPIIRVVIHADSSVTLYGSKASYDSPDYLLEEMQLTNGNTFNNITWNEKTTNEVIISQLIASTTMMVGNGYGRLEIPCDATYCYKESINTTGGLSTNVGITSLNRAGVNEDNWPMTRKGGWLALESKTKGFVVNRVAFDLSGNPVGIPTANFVDGMMVYDTTNKCLNVYTLKEGDTEMAWHCMSTPACPPEDNNP